MDTYARTLRDLFPLKSLVFFSDAERDPVPDILLPIAWDAVKECFLNEVKKMF